ncbi:MAG: tRNA (N(6)-L-threonylcarbamoyladenosine(37)-C(2))-methylthiotransferase MtaB, partial [Erysipelotrichaceae bacterium]|nr:tRNA (N(6)-L-threonylcarbamoyladenosine(37)-C(2))-methylthiotransferase MtaB [Erysipelotrichaceae bacterium]
MTENLENAGYILTDNVEEANIAIVNTCSVTNTADSKSLKTLRQVKKNNPNIILIACGCLAQVNS